MRVHLYRLNYTVRHAFTPGKVTSYKIITHVVVSYVVHSMVKHLLTKLCHAFYKHFGENVLSYKYIA